MANSAASKVRLPRSMTETWIKPNRRVLLLSLLPVGMVAATGLLIVFWASHHLLWWIASGLLVLAGLFGMLIVRQAARPRVAYKDGQVLFYLLASRPIAVPVEVVEAFFVGQTPVKLPGPDLGHTESINLVARLSQKYPEWADHEVKHALGSWCDGYVTIRGTWCETIDEQLVRRLNRRLTEVSRALRDSPETERP